MAGATGGFGSRFVAQLIDAGPHVTAVGRDPERLGMFDVGAAQAIALDLRFPNVCTSAVHAVASHGPIDLLINATGVVAFGMVSELSIDAMHALFLPMSLCPSC